MLKNSANWIGIQCGGNTVGAWENRFFAKPQANLGEVQTDNAEHRMLRGVRRIWGYVRGIGELDMRDYTEVIRTLAGIDMPRPSESEMRKILRECLSTIGILEHTLHQTYTLIRVRRNMDSRPFTSTSQLSYRPRGNGGSSNRANTGQTSLFYAASCERREFRPVMRAFTDEDYGLKVALFESLVELRDNFLYGHGQLDPTKPMPLFRVRTANEIKDIPVTYGVWETKVDVRLAIVCPSRMHDEDWSTQHLRRHILDSYVIADPFERLNEHRFWDYLAYEFSNLGHLAENPDYAVSAITAEILCDMGFDGLSYPSTRCDGRGINVAIRPDVVDTSLRCTKVGLIRVNAQNRELLIDHKKTVELALGVNTFDFMPD